MKRGLPSKLPELVCSQDLTWVLKAAFAPTDSGLEELAPAAPFELAEQLGLAERIWARHRDDPERLKLPTETSDRFRARFHQSAAVFLIHERLARQLSEITMPLGVELVVLKGFALTSLGRLCPGSRPLTDLDVLLPEASVRPIQRQLVAQGATEAQEPANDQHLPRLHFESGAALDLHFQLRDLAFDDQQHASFEALSREGHLEPIPDYPAHVCRLRRRPQAAHLLVHGFEQHLLRPGYPLFRTLGDLIDLLRESSGWHAFESEFGKTMDLAVPAEMRQALGQLSLALAAGELAELESDPESPAARVLRHVVGTSTSHEYTRSLRWLHRWRRFSGSVDNREGARYLRRKMSDLLRPRS